jgi:hypothetical protein
MTKIVSSFSAIAITLSVLFHAGAAEATSARTWVSSSGSDTNPCTRPSPCATFNIAVVNTAAGGEVDVLDGGEFGPVNITQALTIANDGAGTAAITVSNYDAIYINAGSTDAVVLRGLNLNGGGNAGVGIVFVHGASLLIENCKIQGFSNPAIWAAPAVGAARVSVTDRRRPSSSAAPPSPTMASASALPAAAWWSPMQTIASPAMSTATAVRRQYCRSSNPQPPAGGA